VSAYTRVATKIKRPSCLIKALQKLGFKSHMIETFDTAMGLKGYHGDVRSQKAHIRIKGSGWGNQNYVGNASNDLGWEKLEDGSFAFHVSDYDQSKYDRAWQNKLLNYYAAEVVREVAEENSFFIEEEEEINGEITLIATTLY